MGWLQKTRGLIVWDSVFKISGDDAALVQIVALLIARGARVNPCAAKWKGPKLFGLSSQRFGV